jgi:hypothetical protein
MSRLFDRYDAAALARICEDVGVFAALRSKGFSAFELGIADAGRVVPHIALHASKEGRRHLLLEAYLRRIALSPAGARASGALVDAPLDLVLVHWVREEDPTAAFAPDRPPLLLQHHPGLGVLRRAFRIVVRIATELGADGVANRPKFFHDATIFYRSRLFLFLDGREQGRFEALHRDLEALPLGEATVAVAGWCVRDQRGRTLRWHPGFQIFPISPRLTAHFHSPGYAAAVAAARQASRFRVDNAGLARARAQLGLCTSGDTPARRERT